MLSLSLSSFYATRLSRQADQTDRAQQRMSSGQRINRSADDPAGLSIADHLRQQINGSQQADRNIQDAMNLVKIGEDGVEGMLPIVQRMRELVVQASNGTYSDDQRQAMQDEVDSLKQLIPMAYQQAHASRIALDGKNTSDRILEFQVGPNPGDIVSVDYNDLRGIMYNFVVQSYGYEELYNSPFSEMLVAQFGTPMPKPTDVIPTPPPPTPSPYPPGTTFAQAFPKQLVINPGTGANIDQSFNAIDTFQKGLVGQAAYLGSIVNRLQAASDSVSSAVIDLQDSESRIRDVDMAAQMVELTKSQVLQQSAQAMLAQSNARPMTVLQLLGNGR
jgi:flagellin